MQISRERFIDRFWPGVKVHALNMRTVRRKAPPTVVGGAMYDAMAVSAGNIPITRARFSELLDPIIVELHRTTPRTIKPDAGVLLGLAYDVLTEHQVEITIRPPIEAHGGGYSSRSR